MSQRLSDVIEEYLASGLNGARPNTIKAARQALDQFLAYTGNVQIKSLNDRHFDAWFAHCQSRKLAPTTLNVQRNAYRQFIAYCQRRRYISARSNPIIHIKSFKVPTRERLRIPQQHFGRLLDNAQHPRDRVLIALGLYLFLRASEITALRIRDLNLIDGELRVKIIKTAQGDVMPICRELDVELRRWLEFYTTDVGAELDPNWYLIPAHAPPTPHWDPEVKRWTAEYNRRHLAPETPIRNAARMVSRVLERAGYPLRQENGKSSGEGVHTLRRSGARALFDKLADEGYDGAIRTVQSMMHHSNSTMTERYLGIGLDIKKRDDLLKRRSMFDTPTENVVQLRPVKEGN